MEIPVQLEIAPDITWKDYLIQTIQETLGPLLRGPRIHHVNSTTKRRIKSQDEKKAATERKRKKTKLKKKACSCGHYTNCPGGPNCGLN